MLQKTRSLHYGILNTGYMKQHKTHREISQNTVLDDILHTLVKYGKTQLLLVFLITVVTWIVLSLLGIRYSFLLAVLTGALSVVPVVGMLIASCIASLVAIVDGIRFLEHIPVFVEGLVVFAIYGLLNFSTDYFLSPYLIGSTTNIHPLMLLIGVIIATALFGLPGAILVTPILLVSKTILDHYRQ